MICLVLTADDMVAHAAREYVAALRGARPDITRHHLQRLITLCEVTR